MRRSASSLWDGIGVVVDTTWGDGGKGKIVDYGAQYADMVIRYSGGGNAGHTICNPLGTFKLHLVPSGIFHPHIMNVIAAGVVVDPLLLVQEIGSLRHQGIGVSEKNMLVSTDAHLILPWHKRRDSLQEATRGQSKIGTTGKGIGPAYSDRAARRGLRVRDLLHPDAERLVREECAWQERIMQAFEGPRPAQKYDAQQIWEEVRQTIDLLRPFIADTLPLIWQYQDAGRRIVGEGAQGALLDLDLGSYPYVTSSHPGAAGFTIATGISGRDLRAVIGVTKAYATRVGGGPMPTELSGKASRYLQTTGCEVGTTTGRVRRCGWLDAPAVSFGARIAGASCLAITKLDVLDGLNTVKICVGYKVHRKTYTTLPTVDTAFMEKAVPVYESLPGWGAATQGIRSFSRLPGRAQAYIQRIEELIGLPVSIISVGPGREETIYR